MTGDRRALLEAFIRSDVSPDGKWWLDVPVGLSIGDPDTYATVDAVCLTSRDPELPEEFPDHDGVPYVYHEVDAEIGLGKADAFRALRETDTFDGASVVLVGAESGASSVGTVGDLLAHQELLEADWDWTVEERVLVSDTDSDHVTHVCRALSVRPVRVA
ncbi:hypothetical protein GCM10008995_25820 [Halobellus salinus]|uniref:Uncharacterized protein n=1 Tax=Halobellus salinus TaxID=931585 RepID=A0A830EIG8_9EURY|nr:hypothetical protein [Halobellus salinus]GGJ14776.1 hypothetical protein GCM10008995_25820 [Halobellus salinus]SMP15517.1 hypothetical protein SAMN06265347_105148 [Halobellus salinus]